MNTGEISERVLKNDIDKDNMSPVFSSKPIPKKYMFNGANNFLIFFDPYAYEDKRYANKKLVFHFQTTLPLIQQIIDEMDEQIMVIQRNLSDIYSKNLSPVSKKMIPANSEFWRKRVILYIKKNKYQRIFFLKKLMIVQNFRDTLINLIKLVEYLCLFPRMVGINHSSINRISSVCKSEIYPDLQNRIRSIDIALSDIKIVMIFTPKLFSKPEDCVVVLNATIQNVLKFKDPLSAYIPETEDANTFADFVRSRFCPIRWAESQKTPLDARIEITIEMISSFAGIKTREHVGALAALSARYWFNKSLVCNQELRSSNTRLQEYIASLKNAPLSSVKIPKHFAKIAAPHSTPLAFYIAENHSLEGACDIMNTLIFYSCPIDIAYNIHLIHLILSGFVAKRLKLDINHKKVIETMPFMWKIVFIVTNIPYPDALFDFIKKWAMVDCIPPMLLERCQIPAQVIVSWSSEI